MCDFFADRLAFIDNFESARSIETNRHHILLRWFPLLALPSHKFMYLDNQIQLR